MKLLELAGAGERLSLHCLGAHSDDIEIGAGATILGLIERGVCLDVHWAVLSATGQRADEARATAAATGPRGRQGSPAAVALPQGWLTDPDDCTIPAGAEVMNSGG